MRPRAGDVLAGIIGAGFIALGLIYGCAAHGADELRPLPVRGIDPPWAWDIVGTPRCGKYPGDKPDIGAWEWLPNALATNGVWCGLQVQLWNGKTLSYNPHDPKRPNALQKLEGVDP